jgi:erythrin-vacuolar iron transport family protein
MTALGGIGHTLPFLLTNFQVAFGVAVAVVLIELALIAWIRHRFMDSPWLSATMQVILGGTLVFIAGVWIGSS